MTAPSGARQVVGRDVEEVLPLLGQPDELAVGEAHPLLEVLQRARDRQEEERAHGEERSVDDEDRERVSRVQGPVSRDRADRNGRGGQARPLDGDEADEKRVGEGRQREGGPSGEERAAHQHVENVEGGEGRAGAPDEPDRDREGDEVQDHRGIGEEEEDGQALRGRVRVPVPPEEEPGHDVVERDERRQDRELPHVDRVHAEDVAAEYGRCDDGQDDGRPDPRVDVEAPADQLPVIRRDCRPIIAPGAVRKSMKG